MKKHLGIALEIGGGLLLLQIANYLVARDDMGFRATGPWPYLVLILLLAMQYGSVIGLVGALATAVLYAINLAAWHPEAFSLVQTSGTPLACFALALFVGNFADRYRRRLDALGETKVDLDRQLANLSERFDLTQKSVSELQELLARQQRTQGTYFEISRRFTTLVEQELHHEVLAVVVEQMAAESCSLYLLEGETLRRADHAGRIAAADDALVLPADRVPWRLLIREGRVVTLPELVRAGGAVAAPGSPQTPMLCGPLTIDGKCVGAVAVWRMPFFGLNPIQVRMFDQVMNLASQALENARAYQSAEEKRILEPTTGFFTFQYMRHRLSQDYLHAKRKKESFSLLFLQAPGLEKLPKGVAIELIQVLGTAVMHNLRGVDVIARHPEPHALVCLLDTGSAEGLGVLRGRLLERLDEYGFAAGGDRPEAIELQLLSRVVDPQATELGDLVEEIRGWGRPVVGEVS